MEKITIQGVELTLAEPDEGESEWIDYFDYRRQLEAAWLRLSSVEPPLNPRLIGEPGLGKTTLARAIGRGLGREVYIFQCTMDTRPEDLLITPCLRRPAGREGEGKTRLGCASGRGGGL